MTQETINQIIKFRDDREWKQFHNPKDLAISISLEASELLEVFQWSGADTSSKNKKAKELGIPILSEEDFLKTYNIPYEE